jgi:hypothetical protein
LAWTREKKKSQGARENVRRASRGEEEEGEEVRGGGGGKSALWSGVKCSLCIIFPALMHNSSNVLKANHLLVSAHDINGQAIVSDSTEVQTNRGRSLVRLSDSNKSVQRGCTLESDQCSMHDMRCYPRAAQPSDVPSRSSPFTMPRCWLGTSYSRLQNLQNLSGSLSGIRCTGETHKCCWKPDSLRALSRRLFGVFIVTVPSMSNSPSTAPSPFIRITP